MTKTDNVVAIFPYNRDKLMLVKRNEEPFIGQYMPITGHIEKDESEKECLVRELFEELYSCELSKKEILDNYKKHNFKKLGETNYKKNGINCVVKVYTCQLHNENFNLSDEISEIKNIDEINLNEINKEISNILMYLVNFR